MIRNIPTVRFNVRDDNYKCLDISLDGSSKKIQTNDKSGELRLPVDWFNKSGAYSFTLTASDYAGNISNTKLNYYYNNDSVNAADYVPVNITAI